MVWCVIMDELGIIWGVLLGVIWSVIWDDFKFYWGWFENAIRDDLQCYWGWFKVLMAMAWWCYWGWYGCVINDGLGSHWECFVLLGFYADFNIISVISRWQFTYSWSLRKQTGTMLENMPCPSAHWECFGVLLWMNLGWFEVCYWGCFKFYWGWFGNAIRG